jgi:hypothetical protein
MSLLELIPDGDGGAAKAPEKDDKAKGAKADKGKAAKAEAKGAEKAPAKKAAKK